MFPAGFGYRIASAFLCLCMGATLRLHAAVVLSSDFELSPQMQGWTNSGSGSATWTTLELDSGGHSIVCSNAGWYSPLLNTTPLAWYRLSFKSKAAGTPTNLGSDGYAYWAAVFFDPAGNLLTADQYSSVFASPTWVTNEFCIRAKHTANTNGTLTPARMQVLFKALDAPLYIDDVVVETITPKEAAQWADHFYDLIPAKLAYVPKPSRWSRLPHTIAKLRNGERLRIVMLGDSVQQDTANAPVDAWLAQLFPSAQIELISSTRSGTGAQYYKDHVAEFILVYQPDLLVIGGISNEDNMENFQSIVSQVRADDLTRSRTTEMLLLSRQWSPNNTGGNSYFLAPGMKELDPIPANNVFIPDDYRGHLLAFCATNQLEFLDMTGIASEFIYGPATAAGLGAPDPNGAPYSYWMRDWVHGNDRAKIVLGRILEAYFAPPPVVLMTKDDNDFLLRWPVANTGYHLESRAALTTNVTWISNATTVTITNGQFVWNSSAASNVSTQIFYRLRQP
jgi:hypothetical protein